MKKFVGSEIEAVRLILKEGFDWAFMLLEISRKHLPGWVHISAFVSAIKRPEVRKTPDKS